MAAREKQTILLNFLVSIAAVRFEKPPSVFGVHRVWGLSVRLFAHAIVDSHADNVRAPSIHHGD